MTNIERLAEEAIKRINEMTIDELEAEFKKHGWDVVRKPEFINPENNCLQNENPDL